MCGKGARSQKVQETLGCRPSEREWRKSGGEQGSGGRGRLSCQMCEQSLGNNVSTIPQPPGVTGQPLRLSACLLICRKRGGGQIPGPSSARLGWGLQARAQRMALRMWPGGGGLTLTGRGAHSGRAVFPEDAVERGRPDPPCPGQQGCRGLPFLPPFLLEPAAADWSLRLCLDE